MTAAVRPGVGTPRGGEHAALLGDAIDGLESFQRRTRTRASRT